MLRENQSTEAHLNAVRRHMRLCGMGKPGEKRGGEGLVAAIKPVYDELLAKRQATAARIEARQDALDTVVHFDGELDDAVRTVYERCVQFDRKSDDPPVTPAIFPGGKFGPLLAVDREVKPEAVEKAAIRIESLGAQHPVHGLAAELRQAIDASRKAIGEHRATYPLLQQAVAEEGVARLALRRRYELNYLNARAAHGKTVAERLFPKVALKPAAATRDDEPKAA